MENDTTPPKSATIIDVANLAGVSVATVSRVVNKNYPVKPATREAVDAAIKKLNYVPNIQARELNQRSSTTIGVVVPSLYNMFFAEVIDGMEDACKKNNYSLLLNCAKNDPDQEQQCIRALMARNVAGIIVISPNTEGLSERFYRQLARRTPFVFINGYRDIPGTSYIQNDEGAGFLTALRYLKDLGHKRILFVRGVHSDSYTVKEMVYTDFIREERREPFIINIGEGNSVETVDNTAAALTAALPSMRPTAVICCNDLMAMGALNAARSLGLSVPEDISIVGFDNISLARYISPKLTTMDQNMFELGKGAAELVLERIDGQTPRKIRLQNHLVERETTGKAKM